MDNIFSLDSYKNYLIDFYKNKYDEERIKERKQYIEKYCSDEFLNLVVNNSKLFILQVVRHMTEQISANNDKVCFKKDISTYIFKNISNGCSGGWYADRLFCPNEKEPDVLVSEYLIKSFFGKKFIIDIFDDLTENYDEEDEIGYMACTTFLAISGPQDKFFEIMNNNFEDKICLVKKM